MISPSLMTYRFYRNLPEKEDQMDRLHRRLIELGVCKRPGKISRNMRNFEDAQRKFNPQIQVINTQDSLAISAFSMHFHADPDPVTPICSPEHLDAAKIVLRENLIDAYIAGIPSEKRRYDWYYEGNILAVAVTLSNMLVVRIKQDELSQVLDLICNSNAIEQIAGTQKDLRQSIATKCYEAGFNFKFLAKIKGWNLF